MPSIKLKPETKNKIDQFMADELRMKLAKATPKQKKEIYISLVSSRYGITYDEFINKLLGGYTRLPGYHT